MKDGKFLTMGIETSCDETAIAILADGRTVLSNVISSQIDIFKNYGGVVPEIASRHHLENINGVLDQSLEEAGVTLDDIDLIGVTHGPGLVGALLMGVSTAKALAFARERKAHKDGDVQRGRNQMKIMKAVIRKMMSPTLLLRYTSILDAAQGCLETSMDSESITALLKMQIQDGGDWNIETFHVDGYAETCWTYSYAEKPLSVLIPDMESVQQAQMLIQQVKNGEALDLG